MPNIWPNCAGLPPGAAAALAALHLGEPRPELLTRLDEHEALDALTYCDRSQLSLPLHLVVPAFLSHEMSARAAKNVVRLRGLESVYGAIRKLLAAPAALDYVALKGITQCALSGMRLEDRVQHDVDLYLPRPSAETARDRFVAEGYEPIEGMESFPTDHLPALVRRGQWQWRGDFFDPDMPLAVELHFQLWNPALERLPAPGVDEF